MSSPQHYSTQASVSPENVFEIFLHYVGPHAPNECTVLMRPTTGICCKASERDFNYLQPQVSHSVYSMCVQVLSLHFFRSLLLTLSLLCWFYWCGCSNDLCTFVHLHANRFSICCCSSVYLSWRGQLSSRCRFFLAVLYCKMTSFLFLSSFP